MVIHQDRPGGFPGTQYLAAQLFAGATVYPPGTVYPFQNGGTFKGLHHNLPVVFPVFRFQQVKHLQGIRVPLQHAETAGAAGDGCPVTLRKTIVASERILIIFGQYVPGQPRLAVGNFMVEIFHRFGGAHPRREGVRPGQAAVRIGRCGEGEC